MRAILMFCAMVLTGPAQAQAPKLVTDIAPVHGLVSAVTGDLGSPGLLLDPDDDPHGYQLRPSQARALAGADLVIWMGPALTPWMTRTLNNLDTAHLDLLPANAVDPHGWLDPAQAETYLARIADALATRDPDNAASYRDNAETAIARLTDLRQHLTRQLADVDADLIPSHDAYGGFFAAFGLHSETAISDHEAHQPGAAHMHDIAEHLHDADHACILAEPGQETAIRKTLQPDDHVAIVTVDPIGAAIPLGPEHYFGLLQSIADAISSCETSH